jgi:hypothetical protein
LIIGEDHASDRRLGALGGLSAQTDQNRCAKPRGYSEHVVIHTRRSTVSPYNSERIYAEYSSDASSCSVEFRDDVLERFLPENESSFTPGNDVRNIAEQRAFELEDGSVSLATTMAFN